jgi:hypothetical protein
MLLPKMFRIRQTFERPMVEDIKETVEAELKKLFLEKKSNQVSVAITAGSGGCQYG